MNSPIGIPSLADLYTQPFVVIGQDQRVRLVDRAVEEVYGIAWEPAAGGVMPGELVQVDEPADATAATATPGPDAGLRMVGGPGRFRRILGKPIQAQPTRTPPMTLRDLETAHLRAILSTHGGNRRAAAEALQISERTLYRKLRRYGLS